MKLADDRGRVPFALVAVLLVVGSATLAATMRARQPGGADSDVGAAVDRAAAATRTVATQAVDRAARRAARDPVLEPANTTYGRLIDGSTPFRDYFRIRAYLAVRRSLAGVTQRVGAVRADASLPPVETPRDLRRAMGRVELSTNGTTLEVRIRNVTFTARRGNRTLRRTNRTVAVGVDNPVLVLHDRTQEFEARLDRGPLEGPGLGRRLTALLYPVGYARGYAFYGGLPIQNVLGNRHVELMTNAGILGVQRRVFGTADESARSVLQGAVVQVALRDLTAPVVAAAGQQHWWVPFVTGHRPPPQQSVAPYSLPLPDGPSPEDNVTVGVNGTADVAFGNLFGDPAEGPTYGSVVNRTYAADATLSTAVERLGVRNRSPPDPPGDEWELVETYQNVTRTATIGGGPRPRVPDGWHGHRLYTRRVVEHHHVTRRWTNGSAETTTTADYETVFRVGIRVVDDHAPNPFVPDNPIDVVHERGGPLGGPNLLWVPETATDRLVADRGGPDAIARRTVNDSLARRVPRIRGRRPPELREWVYRDLVALRERVRNVTVAVPRGKLATTVNAPARLASAVQKRRDALVDAPEVYDSVADKVRVAARAAYVDRVLAELRENADRVNRTQSGIDDALGQNRSNEDVSRMIETRNRSLAAGVIRTADGPLSVTVDGAPSYLPLAPVDHELVPDVPPGAQFHALVAENINLFTVPFADAAKAVVDELGKSTDNTSLRTAATTLRAARRALSRVDSPVLSDRVPRLRKAVSGSLRRLLNATADPVGRVTDLSRPEALSVVRGALDRWNNTANRTFALLDGSAVGPIVAAVDREASLTAFQRDALVVSLQVALSKTATRERVRVSVDRVSPVSNATRSAIDSSLYHGTKDKLADVVQGKADQIKTRFTRTYGDRLQATLKKRAGKLFPEGKTAMVPSGLPVTPVPAYWYFTTNVWVVNVKGTYARFTVRARTGGPGGVAYTRDGGSVSVDVDGDGTPERLGSASRVSFSTGTVVTVVVPPGGKGVGDVDGDMFERSRGWCTPGLANRTKARC